MCLLAGALLCTLSRGEATDATSPQRLETPSFSVEVSPEGRIHALVLPREERRIALRGSIRLGGCDEVGEPQVEILRDDGLLVTRRWKDAEGNGARVEERFSPTPRGLRWQCSVTGENEHAWSCPIEVALRLPDPTGQTFWTAWDDPRSRPGWHDPFTPLPFEDHVLWYGQESFEADPYVGYPQRNWNQFSLPMVAVLDQARDFGFTLALSPEDALLDLSLSTTADGEIIFSHTHHRIQRGRPLRFTMDLFTHAGDWRPALAGMVERYPDYFNPPNPAASEMAGMGAYSRHEGELDAAKFHRMAFRINWKASFDFAYLGMYLPPDRSVGEWRGFYKQPTSIRRMEESTRAFRELGFHTLNYFNVTEFGQDVRFPPPPPPEDNATDLWRDPNLFLHYRVADGILHASDGKTPYFTWYDAVAMDCGAPDFRAFLLDQADRHLAELPSSAGICIDRTDWLRFYNPLRDDGASWMWDRPVASLRNSWKDILEELGEKYHAAGKVIFINNTASRLDVMRHVDGIFDEATFLDSHLNKCAFECLRKPLVCWTPQPPYAQELQSDPDRYMQQNLYMGGYPMAPFPGNDHSNPPDPAIERVFTDYGPLFDAIRGKQWVLSAHAVRVKGGSALANLFKVPGGDVVPVVHGLGSEATVVLRNPQLVAAAATLHVDVLHPGAAPSTSVEVVREDGALRLTVPLVRGCALVRLRQVWMQPERGYFFATGEVEIKTAVPGAVIRYTLNGGEPTVDSPVYTGSLALADSAVVRAAAIKAGGLSRAARRTFTRLPLPPPVLTSPSRIFAGSTTVEVRCSAMECDVEYSLGSSGTLPAWRRMPRPFAPITLYETTTLLARSVLAGASPSPTARLEVLRRPPRPPLPMVFISDLTASTATVGWGGFAKMDLSIENRPLSLAGRVYAKGVGVVPASDLVYPLRPEHRRFVATVGIDDEMRAYAQASAVFQVWVDGTRLAESPVLRSGELWYLDVALPRGGREITLRCTDAGDGIDCDHADWADVGFR